MTGWSAVSSASSTPSFAGLSFVREARGVAHLLLEVVLGTGRTIAQRRFPLEEYVRQTWFTIRVCTLPALAVSVPFGVILALQVGVLAQEVGATGFTGAGNTLAVVRQAAPLITALMLAGVAGSAICADLGSRRIRDEIDAMQVMGVRVEERLVLPRMLATVTVAVLLNGVVMFFSIVTTLLVSVIVQGLSSGGYLASASLLTQPSDLVLSLVKAAIFGLLCAVVSAHVGLGASRGPAGVSEAVTRAVVANFIVLFAANVVITQVANAVSGGIV